MQHPHFRPCLAAMLLVGAFPLAHAERPMVVDDAGTLDAGGYKLEGGWYRDDGHRGFDFAAGMSPVENLELEIGFARGHDSNPNPSEDITATGFAVKWVPLQPETGLALGLKYSYGDDRVRAGGHVGHGHVQALLGLAAWRFEEGPMLLVNLGREWAREAHDGDNANVWGVGGELPLSEAVTLTIETFGAQHGRPDRQVGLRYEIAEGLKLSAGIGNGNDRSFSTLGIAWEF